MNCHRIFESMRITITVPEMAVWRTCSKKWPGDIFTDSITSKAKWWHREMREMRSPKFSYRLVLISYEGSFLPGCAWFVPPNFQVVFCFVIGRIFCCQNPPDSKLPRHVRERWAAALDHFLQLLTHQRWSHCRGNSYIFGHSQKGGHGGIKDGNNTKKQSQMGTSIDRIPCL